VKTSLIDYPGKVAAVVFTRGCMLRCHYCHNPQIVVPECFIGPISEEYVMEFLEDRKGKLDGVVVSGGEPMMHSDIARFLKQIKRMGYSVKLDTSGVFPDALKAVIDEKLVDYIAMDIKAPFERYSEVAGAPVNTDSVKRSIELVKGSGIDYEFRTTVVKGQLSEDDLVRIAESVKGSKRYMLQRFRKCDTLDQTFANRDTYTDEEFGRAKSKVDKYVESCGVR
jgi:pyruvate formate lyase activating enzyme